MARTVASYYRGSESLSGVQVTVEAGRAPQVEGDARSPLSAGQVDPLCAASLAMPGDPRRITSPMRREGGALRPCSWDEALDAAGAGLRAAKDAGGPGAIGLYAGAELAAHPLACLRAAAFATGQGTRHLYTPLVMHGAARLLAAEWVTGAPMPLQADVGRAHYAVLLGADQERAGWGPFQSGSIHTQAMLYFHKRRKENKLVTVDNRRSGLSARAEQHVNIRPGTEAFFLLGMANAILLKGWTDEQYLRDYAKNVERLREWLTPWDVARCGEICGVDPGDISGVALKFSRAAMGVVALGHAATQSRYGGVAAWAWLVVHALTANLLRPGGLYEAKGAVDLHPIAASFPSSGAPRTREGGLPSLLLQAPGTALAGEILTPGDGQLRALISVGGCPVSELPEPATTTRALSSLDCLIAMDVLESPTTALAHVVLPARHFWERRDLMLLNHSALPSRMIQATEAVLPAPETARDEADVLAELYGRVPAGLRLGGAWGRHITLAGRALATADLDVWVDRLLEWSKLPDRASLEARGGPLELGEHDRASWRVTFDDGRLDLAPDALSPVMTSLRPPEADPARPYRLATTAAWPGGHGRTLRAADAEEPGVLAHPDCGLKDGATVLVETAHGQVRGRLRLSADLRPDTILVPWGWAVPANELVGLSSIDPLTGAPDQEGLPCALRAV
ncbi:MAG: molybdopterin-dependent oxidoreductase [Deltaproteobacteria bacterium]|nr:molybdopterin-dependent oxidoreductase [Deltaproteobacteria bacterium]